MTTDRPGWPERIRELQAEGKLSEDPTYDELLAAVDAGLLPTPRRLPPRDYWETA